MANSTILQLVQAFCREYAQPTPASIQGSSDAGALQMRELVQTIGEFAWSKANWQQCVRYKSWLSAAGADQGDLNALFPLQFASLIQDTLWDNTAKQKFKGPISTAQWQAWNQMSGGFPPYAYSIVNNRLETSSALPAAHTMSAYYKSRNWIISGGSEALIWATDSDTCVFADRLIKAGLKAFWLRIKQMPHRFEMEAFEDIVLQEATLNMFKAPLSIDGSDSNNFGIVIPTWNAIP